MILFKRASDINKYLSIKSKLGIRIGFIPTMGALHAGHISLINECKKQCAISVVSIFINPTQFNNPSDYAKYPITLSADILKLEQSGCDLLFLPPIEEIYPNGIISAIQYDLGYLETVLEGKYRPGHFQGVCQVMNRLLEIIIPNILYLGQKDYQQCMVIKKLLTITKPTITINVVITLRESSGLAMSSRNLRLTDKDKEKAVGLFQSLQYLRSNLVLGDLANLKMNANNILQEKGITKIDYLTIADANTLESIESWDGRKPLVGLVAAYLHEVRLIDNIILHALETKTLPLELIIN